MVNSILTRPSQSTKSKFIWTIENFSRLNNKETHYSNRFEAGGYKCLAVFNQKDQKKTVRWEAKRLFTDDQGWGFSNMIPLSDLHDPDKGFIVNDTCIVQLEITVSWPYNDSNIKVASSTRMVKSEIEVYPDAGEPFEIEVYPDAGEPFEIDQEVVFSDENHEIVGGFSVLRRQASLYKRIWLKYGHIPSTTVLPATSYNSLVTLVTDIMNTIIDMYRCRYVDVSAELIDTWRCKIILAEKLEFNVAWLIERFNDVCEDYDSGRIEKLQKEEEEKEGPTPLVRVKNEPVDDIKESLPGFLFEGML
ncbi:hypothetical protein MKX03_014600 [Papaver bracteatum]|nr:hypothetical protein MKX03_014600 [Papaver bracteatum]